jgi:hypothetical protein
MGILTFLCEDEGLWAL